MTTTDANIVHSCQAWAPGLKHLVDAHLVRGVSGALYLDIDWNKYDTTRREIVESTPHGEISQRLVTRRGFVYFISRADWLAIQPSIVEFSGALERVA